MPLKARAVALMLLLLMQSLACLVGVQISQKGNLLAHALVHGQGLDHHHHENLADGIHHHSHDLNPGSLLHPDAFAFDNDEHVDGHALIDGHQHVHDGLQIVGLPLTPHSDLARQVSLVPPAFRALAPRRIVLEGLLRPPRTAFA